MTAIATRCGAGTVVVWGSNSYGVISNAPTWTNIVAIAAGMSHCLALNDTNRAIGWGWDYFGQASVPDNLTDNYGRWIQVNGAISNIAAGDWHSMVLLNNRTVLAWGDSSHGATYPQQDITATAIDGGTSDSLALKPDGTIAKWGCSGICYVPDNLTNMVAIDDGQYYSLALRGDGTIAAWGLNNFGQTDVPLDLTNVVAVSAGNYLPMALRADGTVAVWGSSDAYGQMNIPPGLSNVVAIATGNGACVALRTDGTVAAWGYIYAGGGGMPASLSNVVAIASGGVSMAIQSDGRPQFIYGRPSISVLPKRKMFGGESVLLHASAVGAAPLTYFWNRDGTNVAVTDSPNLSLTNLLGSQSGNYTVIASNFLGIVECAPVPLEVDPMIYITNQPSPVTIYEAGDANFSVTVGGYGPFNYQWRLNGTDLPGETNITLALAQVATNQAGNYSVILANAYGTLASSNAALSVLLPFLTAQPTNRTVFAGDAASFRVTATGAALSYQWQFNGTNLPGATSNVLTLTLTDTNSAGSYAALVSNAYRTLTTSNATLTVVPLTASVSPASQSVYVGDPATFSAVVQKNGPFTYQWRSNSVNIVDATNATLNLTALTTNESGVNYSVRVANPYGEVESAPATLTVVDAPASISGGPPNRFTWLGNSVSFSVSVNGTKPISYQWSFNGTTLTNATNVSLSLATTTMKDVGTYSVTVSNTLGGASGSSTLTLEPVVGWGNMSGFLLPPLSNAVAISAGYSHHLALKSDGTVFAWGSSSTLPAANSNFSAVAAGYNQSIGLRSNGTVVAWGTGTLPVAPASLTNAAFICVGKQFSTFALSCFAIRSNSTVAAWSNSSYSPTNIPTGLASVIGVAAGVYHALAVKSDGTLAAWQDYSDYGANALPSAVSNASHFIAVAAGASHSLALRTNGTVVAWGNTANGKTNVPLNLTNVVAIAAGHDHNLAIRGDGTVVSWGLNSSGQTNVPAMFNSLGLARVDGGAGYSLGMMIASDPAIVRQPASTVAVVRQPVLLSVGAVSKQPLNFQWRLNNADIPGATNALHRIAALGPGDRGDYTVVVSNASGALTSTVARVGMTGNAVVAWGQNSSGQTNVPAGLNALAISGGDWHSLALRAGGTVAAWGTTINGVTNVPAAATNIIAIAAGATHNLALTTTRKTIAWGSLGAAPATFTNFFAIASGNNYSLGLSNGLVAVWNTATPPASVSNAVAIASGYSQALALMPDGRMTNWIGGAPPPATLSNVVSLAGGNGFALAVKTDGTITAWGANGSGQCNVPSGLSNVVAVAAGQMHSLALKSDGTVVGWGSSTFGQTNIPADLSNVVAIAAGGYHSLAMVGSADPAIVRQPAPLYTNITGSLLLSVGAVGSQPLAYQWLTNGVPLPGATSACLYLPLPQTNNSGLYSVVISNALGVVISSNAAVSILSRPPYFMTHPPGQTNFGGGAVSFTASVGGSTPLNFQWQKDSALLPDATNLTLAFNPVARSNSGVYFLTASNAYGVANSSNATLRVLMPQRLLTPAFDSNGIILIGFSDADGGTLSVPDAANFSVEHSTNLTDWQAFTGELTLTNGLLLFRETNNTASPQNFYRVSERP